MNILLINYEFPPLGAGASTATWHIGKELVAMGHRISVLTTGFQNNTGYCFEDGMHVFRCPGIRKKKSESNIIEMLSFDVSAFMFLPWVILRQRIEGCIVFFSFPCGPLGLWANLLFRIPYVISLRGGDVPGNERRLDRIHHVLTPLRRLIYRKSLAVVANSQGLKKLAEKADRHCVHVIPTGIDTSFFKPLKSRGGNSGIWFMFAGRLSIQKNLFTMLDQLAHLKRMIQEEINIHMVGDGPMKKKLQKAAKDLGISENIEWHGWVDKNRLLELYQQSDCFINPSFCEGMPNAVLEAMSCGLPVIASNVPGNNDVISDGENGILYDLNDPSGFQRAFKKVIGSASEMTEMGAKSRKTAKNMFSWKKTAVEYFKIFH